MRKSNISVEQSIKENLDQWCYEVGTEFEEYSRQSVDRFIKYIGKKPVVDLGSGDGAATKYFVENGNKVTAVDINVEKLEKITDAKVIKSDFVSFLTKPVDNIFMHHALEHCSNPEEVLGLIAKHLKKGSYCYIAVPKDDVPHEVHHVAFDSVEELYPPNLEIVLSETVDSPIKEYRIIARKV